MAFIDFIYFNQNYQMWTRGGARGKVMGLLLAAPNFMSIHPVVIEPGPLPAVDPHS